MNVKLDMDRETIVGYIDPTGELTKKMGAKWIDELVTRVNKDLVPDVIGECITEVRRSSSTNKFETIMVLKHLKGE